MSKQATARPWELRGPTRIYGNLQRDQNSTGDLVATCVEPETAALIVRAVNAHDALLEALKRARGALAVFTNCTDAIAECDAAISRALPGGEGK